MEAVDEGNDEPDADVIDEADVLPDGDRGMDMFEPQYETAKDGSKIVSCNDVSVANPLHCDYILSLLAAGHSIDPCQLQIQCFRKGSSLLRFLGRTLCPENLMWMCPSLALSPTSRGGEKVLAAATVL